LKLYYKNILIFTFIAACSTDDLQPGDLDPPEASFTYTEDCDGEAPCLLMFRSMFDNITAISWEFGDGSTSDEEDPAHFYTLPGSYRVKLRVTGPGGINTIEREITLTEGDLTIPPSQLGLDPFYKKYLNVSGIPVISSEYVPHAALKAVKEMIEYMTTNRCQWHYYKQPVALCRSQNR